MTIQKAIKKFQSTGRPFKRKHWRIWMAPDDIGFKYVGQDYPPKKKKFHPLVGKSAELDQEDILAEDWEVKP